MQMQYLISILLSLGIGSAIGLRALKSYLNNPDNYTVIGRSIQWDPEKKQAYVDKDGQRIPFDRYLKSL